MEQASDGGAANCCCEACQNGTCGSGCTCGEACTCTNCGCANHDH